MFEKNDVVQITDENHSWFGTMLIVSEVKSWGVVAYVVIPKSNDKSEPPGIAYNRLKNESIEKVGHTVMTI